MSDIIYDKILYTCNAKLCIVYVIVKIYTLYTHTGKSAYKYTYIYKHTLTASINCNIAFLPNTGSPPEAAARAEPLKGQNYDQLI